MKSEDKVRKLEESLARVKAQRDAIKETRDEFKDKLATETQLLTAVVTEHFELWKEHVLPHYDTAVPDAALVEHISHMRGLQTASGLRTLHEGFFCVQQIRHLLQLARLPKPRSILDFGCGCARMTRYVRLLGNEDTRVVGCDVDNQAIQWNKEHLRQTGEFFPSGDRPPLSLPETDRFDLILVISVFTHLPEDMQHAWLEELMRRVNPGGVLLATYHGKPFHRFIPKDQRKEFAAHGFIHVDRGKTPGLPDYYLTTFHTDDYIKREWGRHGEILCMEDGVAGRQSAAVIRRRE